MSEAILTGIRWFLTVVAFLVLAVWPVVVSCVFVVAIRGVLIGNKVFTVIPLRMKLFWHLGTLFLMWVVAGTPAAIFSGLEHGLKYAWYVIAVLATSSIAAYLPKKRPRPIGDIRDCS